MRKFSIMLLFVLSTFAGCGGGGGGSSTPAVVNNPGTPTDPADPTQPTNATVLKLSTEGTLPADKKIIGIDVTMKLADGALVKMTENGPTPETVQASGVTKDIANDYIPASTDTPGELNFIVTATKDPDPTDTKAPDFGIGEFATVTLMTPAVVPPGTSYVIQIKARDSSGNVIEGITAKAVVQ